MRRNCCGSVLARDEAPRVPLGYSPYTLTGDIVSRPKKRNKQRQQEINRQRSSEERESTNRGSGERESESLRNRE
jgi:hypothetical protein